MPKHRKPDANCLTFSKLMRDLRSKRRMAELTSSAEYIRRERSGFFRDKKFWLDNEEEPDRSTDLDSQTTEELYLIGVGYRERAFDEGVFTHYGPHVAGYTLLIKQLNDALNDCLFSLPRIYAEDLEGYPC